MWAHQGMRMKSLADSLARLPKCPKFHRIYSSCVSKACPLTTQCVESFGTQLIKRPFDHLSKRWLIYAKVVTTSIDFAVDGRDGSIRNNSMLA